MGSGRSRERVIILNQEIAPLIKQRIANALAQDDFLDARRRASRYLLTETDKTLKEVTDLIKNSSVEVRYNPSILEHPEDSTRYEYTMETFVPPPISDSVWSKAGVEILGTDDPTLREVFSIPDKVNKYLKNRDTHSSPNMEILVSELFDKGISIGVVQRAIMNVSRGKRPEEGNRELIKGISLPTITSEEERSMYTDEIYNALYYSTENLNRLHAVSRKVLPDSPAEIRHIEFGKRRDATDHPTALALYQSMTQGITVFLNTMEIPAYNGHRGYTVSNSLLDVVTHEYGHALHHELTSLGKTNPQIDKAFQKYNGLFDFNDKDEKETFLLAVSPYGNTNKAEAFAEAFTMYTTGSSPREGKEYYAQFESLMKDLNLEEYKGINSPANNKLFDIEPITGEKISAPTISSTAPKAKATPVKAQTTLAPEPQKTPDSTAVVKTFKKTLNGKTVTVSVKASDLERGYIRKTINGKAYKIDINTGNILR